MPRKSEPYFRKAQKRWVASIDGRRVTLGKNKKEAFVKYYKRMGNKAFVQLEVNAPAPNPPPNELIATTPGEVNSPRPKCQAFRQEIK